MGKQILAADDFIFNKDITTKNGDIFFDNILEEDYSVGMVSLNTFNLTNNKSVVFEFKADPYIEKKDFKNVWFNKDSIVVIDENKNIIIDNDKTDISLEKVSCSVFVKGSYTNQIVLNNSSLYAFGSNDNNQLDDLPTDNIISADVGNGFIVLIKKNEDNKNEVVVFGKNSNDNIQVPDGINNYDSELKKPLKVSAFNGGVVVIKGDGSVAVWGDDSFVENVNNNSKYKDVFGNDNSIGMLTFDNILNIILFDDENNTYTSKQYKDIQYFKVFNKQLIYVTLDGNTLLNGDIIYQGYPKAFNVDSDGNVYILKFNGDIIGENINSFNCEEKSLNSNKIPQTYKELNENSFNVFFGIQPIDLKEGFEYDTNTEGETIPCLSNNNRSVFNSIANNTQGIILNKSSNGADLLYNIKGRPKKDFLIDNFQVVPDEFIGFKNETYRLVMSFSEFGKTIRLFKIINAKPFEIQSKFISLEEYPPTLSRISLYIKSCSSFLISSVTITDELDTTLLPEEILYRNLDTNLLQTKVAESLHKHVSVIEKTTDAINNITSLIDESFGNYDNSIKKIEERVKTLEES